MKKFYALHKKGSGLSFSIPCEKESDFNDGLKKSFNNWRGMQPKGSNLTMDDFMVDRKKVIVAVEAV